MIYIACYHGEYSTEFLTIDDLIELFNNFNHGRENLIKFLKNETYLHCAPIADITKFNFCPATGEKIDWDYFKTDEFINTL